MEQTDLPCDVCGAAEGARCAEGCKMRIDVIDPAELSRLRASDALLARVREVIERVRGDVTRELTDERLAAGDITQEQFSAASIRCAEALDAIDDLLAAKGG